jgi:ABC transport system ATP-binding/permease protein
MWKLSIDDDQAQRSVVPLSRTEYQIGRADDNQVRLTERNVSRHHARIRRSGRAWMLEDLGSYNGVFVNGTRIAGACELNAGDAIQLGDFLLQLHAEGALAAHLSPGGEAPAVDRLLLLTGPRAGSEFPVGDDIQLGADSACNAHLPYPGVHAQHATLHRVEDERFELIDHAGDGSTQVNGVALPRALLTPGDEIVIGQARLQLVAAGARYAAPVAAAVEAATPDASTSASESPVPAAAAAAAPTLDPAAVAVEPAPDSIPVPPKRKSGMVALLAALAVGGIAVAAVVAFSGSDSDADGAAAPALQAATNDADAAPANPEADRLAKERAAAETAKEAAEAEAREEEALAAAEEQEAADFVAAEEAALDAAQKEAEALAAAKTQGRALVEPARGKAKPKRKKRKKKLTGGIQRSNPFKSTRDLATSGDSGQMREAKRRLLAKARGGKASESELKTLRALCGQLKDLACRSEAGKLLAAKRAR